MSRIEENLMIFFTFIFPLIIGITIPSGSTSVRDSILVIIVLAIGTVTSFRLYYFGKYSKPGLFGFILYILIIMMAIVTNLIQRYAG
jgi:hypothetical protein